MLISEVRAKHCLLPGAIQGRIDFLFECSYRCHEIVDLAFT
jgi:hypothetical protein